MKVINQSWEILQYPAFRYVERAGRTCYQSMAAFDEASNGLDFTRKMIENKHLSMLEFAHMTVKFICDRGVSHELVRHRLCSFAQESTRYCNYKDSVTFIQPSRWNEWTPEQQEEWTEAMRWAEIKYCNLLKSGLKPQDARAVLPNSLKTEIIVKANWREWMHIFELRCSPAAHPDIRELLTSLRSELKEEFPIHTLFD
jgi:thymidylate synthase (FAD)